MCAQMCIGRMLACMLLFIYSTTYIYVRCSAVAGEYSGEPTEVVPGTALPGKMVRQSQVSRLSVVMGGILSDPQEGRGETS